MTTKSPDGHRTVPTASETGKWDSAGRDAQPEKRRGLRFLAGAERIRPQPNRLGLGNCNEAGKLGPRMVPDTTGSNSQAPERKESLKWTVNSQMQENPHPTHNARGDQQEWGFTSVREANVGYTLAKNEKRVKGEVVVRVKWVFRGLRFFFDISWYNLKSGL